jgi:hypothetical protein
LVGIPLRATVWADDHDGGAEVLEEVPAGAGDGEKILIVADVAEDLQSGVMLEEQVHFYADAANVLEHIGELHVFRIRTEAIKSAHSQSSARIKGGLLVLTYHGRQAKEREESEQMPLAHGAGRNGWCSSGSKHERRPPHVWQST